MPNSIKYEFWLRLSRLKNKQRNTTTVDQSKVAKGNPFPAPVRSSVRLPPPAPRRSARPPRVASGRSRPKGGRHERHASDSGWGIYTKTNRGNNKQRMAESEQAEGAAACAGQSDHDPRERKDVSPDRLTAHICSTCVVTRHLLSAKCFLLSHPTSSSAFTRAPAGVDGFHLIMIISNIRNLSIFTPLLRACFMDRISCTTLRRKVRIQTQFQRSHRVRVPTNPRIPSPRSACIKLQFKFERGSHASANAGGCALTCLCVSTAAVTHSDPESAPFSQRSK